ncbi:hypothetical protein CEXT_579361 [Caerostris extrusa]|uniref:Uncharacterized protein n=1 Tax=Caerostris extrusa TaxID=172846 RepID=A0AAV4XJF3_CAEEX|nr:hypothetical protein CEXT_579361 [Caerostris extrusa]
MYKEPFPQKKRTVIFFPPNLRHGESVGLTVHSQTFPITAERSVGWDRQYGGTAVEKKNEHRAFKFQIRGVFINQFNFWLQINGISPPSFNHCVVIGGSPESTAHVTMERIPSSKFVGKLNGSIFGQLEK